MQEGDGNLCLVCVVLVIYYSGYDTFYMAFCVKLFFNNKYTEILPSNGTVIALYYQFMKHKLCLLQSKSKVPGVGPVLVSPFK